MAGTRASQKRTILAGRPFVECHYCGKRLDRGSMTLDHVVPKAKGGRNTHSNFVPSCSKCNRSKGCKDYGDFVRKIDPNCSYFQRAS